MDKWISVRQLMLLNICNASAPNSIFKDGMYSLKSEIIRKYGKDDGFDLQIINKECWSCDGTGTFKSSWKMPETCWSCMGSGLYATHRIMLKRFVLNGQVFHEPRPEQSESDRTPKNIIKGYIRHKQPECNGTYAYAELLWHFKPEALPQLILSYGEMLQTRAKHKYRRCLRKANSMLEGLRDYFGMKPEIAQDELPF